MFKDQVKQDIADVFLNDTEFADEHEVNGKKMPCVLDDSSLEDSPGKPEMILGIYGEQTTLYVNAELYGSVPKKGAAITIDGNRYRIIGASTDMGMYKIVIERWLTRGEGRYNL